MGCGYDSSNELRYSPVRELITIGDTLTGSIVSNMQNSPFGPTSYQFGNGLGDADGLGRVNAGWVCSN